MEVYECIPYQVYCIKSTCMLFLPNNTAVFRDCPSIKCVYRYNFHCSVVLNGLFNFAGFYFNVLCCKFSIYILMPNSHDPFVSAQMYSLS